MRNTRGPRSRTRQPGRRPDIDADRHRVRRSRRSASSGNHTSSATASRRSGHPTRKPSLTVMAVRPQRRSRAPLVAHRVCDWRAVRNWLRQRSSTCDAFRCVIVSVVVRLIGPCLVLLLFLRGRIADLRRRRPVAACSKVLRREAHLGHTVMNQDPQNATTGC